MLKIILLSLVSAVVNSEFMGSLYPYPEDLSSNSSVVAKGWKEGIVAELDAYFDEGTQIGTLINVGMENLTFSMSLFSTLDDGAESLQYFHTAPEVANAAVGTTEVDENSIYAIASVSKLFTVFAGMVSLSEEEWHRPLSKVFPHVFGNSTTDDTGRRSNFDDITAWSLATHMSGLPYWMLPQFDLLASLIGAQTDASRVAELGLPPVDLDSLGACWDVVTGSGNVVCSEEEFLSIVANQRPVFESWRSPEYSNGGMMLLGLTIGAIRNQSLQSILKESVFDPLNMTSSGGNLGNDPEKVAQAVLGAVPETWLTEFTYELGSGGMKTSVADLNKFAKAILSSTLLSPATTRKWLQPASLTPSHSYAVGAPWEIIRYSHPITGRVTDIYTKSGDAGPHGGIVALIPEYQAGFNVLCEAADVTIKSSAMWALFDHIALHLFPSLETEAATEAAAKYAGTYQAPDLNSSLTVALDLSTVPQAAGGLSIVQWISNGTDMLSNPLMPFEGTLPKLLPTIQDIYGAGEVAFFATSNLQTSSYQAAGTGPFKGAYKSNFDWLGISLATYGGSSVRHLVFSVDQTGRASSIRPSALRVELERLE